MAVLLQGGGHDTDADLTALTRPISSRVLVGREKELALLVQAATRRPALALVEGEAGVGKSRLVAELGSRPELRNLRVVSGRCHPLREPFPLGPVVEALRSAVDLARMPAYSPAAGSLRLLLPEMSSHLPPLPEPTGDPRADRHVLFQGVLEMLSHLGPTVCVLEDLHWGDERTWDLLNFLASQMPPQLALIVTYRREGSFAVSPAPELTSRGRVAMTTVYVTLAPLEASEVHHLVSELLPGEDVSEQFLNQLYERTAGIPFAIEEVVRLIHDRRDLFHRAEWWVRRSLEHLDVPSTIRDSVIGRASELATDARRLVDAAAILVTPATERQLAQVAALSIERGATALSQALRAAVLVGGDGGLYGFRHALACQAVYEAIPGPERSRLHLRAAEALEQVEPPPVAQLARHNREGGRPRDVVRYAEMAADQAWARRDAEAAAYFLCEALRVPGLNTATLTCLAQKLCDAACECPTPVPGAVVALQSLAGNSRLPSPVRGWARAVLGTTTGNRNELERSVMELGGGSYQRARVMANLALAIGDDHIGVRLHWLSRATALAAEQPWPQVHLEIATVRATLLAGSGDSRAATLIDALPWGLPVPRDDRLLGEALLSRSHNIVLALLDVGSYSRARAIHERCPGVARHSGWGRWRREHESHAVLLDWAMGNWGGLGDRARSLYEAHAGTYAGGVGHLVSGLLALAQGRIATAEAALIAADATAIRVPLGGMVRSGLTRLHVEHGRPATVTDHPDFIRLILDRLGLSACVGEVLPAAAETLVASGRCADAEALIGRVEKELRGLDAPLAKASVGWSWGVIAEAKTQYADAARAFGRAERQFSRLPRPYDAARAVERRGLCLVEDSDTGAAECLRDSLVRFRRLGAAGDVKRVRRILRSHRIPVPPAERNRAVRGMALSPQEAEVVRFAAAGRTASEISAEVSLSRRTVEQYLRFALRKLSLGHKRELIGRLDLAENTKRPARDQRTRS